MNPEKKDNMLSPEECYRLAYRTGAILLIAILNEDENKSYVWVRSFDVERPIWIIQGGEPEPSVDSLSIAESINFLISFYMDRNVKIAFADGTGLTELLSKDKVLFKNSKVGKVLSRISDEIDKDFEGKIKQMMNGIKERFNDENINHDNKS